MHKVHVNAYIRDEALFHDKILNVKGAICAPAKAYKTAASHWVNQAVLNEELGKRRKNRRKQRRVIHLCL